VVVLGLAGLTFSDIERGGFGVSEDVFTSLSLSGMGWVCSRSLRRKGVSLAAAVSRMSKPWIWPAVL
jgi:hypothetical protein